MHTCVRRVGISYLYWMDRHRHIRPGFGLGVIRLSLGIGLIIPILRCLGCKMAKVRRELGVFVLCLGRPGYLFRDRVDLYTISSWGSVCARA